VSLTPDTRIARLLASDAAQVVAELLEALKVLAGAALAAARFAADLLLDLVTDVPDLEAPA